MLRCAVLRKTRRGPRYLRINACVALHGLTPEDVGVEDAYGRARNADKFENVELVELTETESRDHGRHLFTGSIVIDRPWAFGCTVRVLPKHPAMASKAELGLIVNA
jgi:starch phosphorylase